MAELWKIPVVIRIGQVTSFDARRRSIREKVLGLFHPDTASSFNTVGNACAAIGEHFRAIQCEEKALEI
jgi:hypothetical protein